MNATFEAVTNCSPRAGGDIAGTEKYFILRRGQTCTPSCQTGYVTRSASPIPFGTTTHSVDLSCHFVRAFSSQTVGPVRNCNGLLLGTSTPVVNRLGSNQIALRSGRRAGELCAELQVDRNIATRQCTGGDGSANSGSCGNGYPNAGDPIGCNYQRIDVTFEAVTNCTPRSGGSITGPNKYFILVRGQTCTPSCQTGYVPRSAGAISFGTTTHSVDLSCQYVRTVSSQTVGRVSNCNGFLLGTTTLANRLSGNQVRLRPGETCTVNCAASYQVDVNAATRQCTGGDGSANSGTCGNGYPTISSPIGCNSQRIGVISEAVTDCTPRAGGNLSGANKFIVLNRGQTCTPTCQPGYVSRSTAQISFGTSTHTLSRSCHYTRSFSTATIGPVANCNGIRLGTSTTVNFISSNTLSLRVGESCTVHCGASFQTDIASATRSCTGGTGAPNSGTCGNGYPAASGPIGCNYQKILLTLSNATDCTCKGGR